jgi:hypothetical protein
MNEERGGGDALSPELQQAVGRLPKAIEPPADLWPGIRARLSQRKPQRRYPILLAAAAVILLGIGVWQWRLSVGAASWQVTRLSGRPLINQRGLAASGNLRVGQWIETDDSSRALLAVAGIGQVDVRPGSRVQLVRAQATDQRLALAYGAIHAKVAAPPRLFFVDTPVGTATDLGCEYTLATDSTGRGVIQVTGGYVELAWGGRRSIVPLGASALTRPGFGPGTPFVDDAPDDLRDALNVLDFGPGGTTAVSNALAAARAEDAVTLWHLITRVEAPWRGAVYDRLAALVPPPAGVDRARVQRLDTATLERYWNAIRRIQFRRVILKGVREIDPRTGTARKP